MSHKIFASLNNIKSLLFTTYSYRNYYMPHFMGDGFGSYYNEGNHSRSLVLENEKDNKTNNLRRRHWFGYGCGMIELTNTSNRTNGDGLLDCFEIRKFSFYEES